MPRGRFVLHHAGLQYVGWDPNYEAMSGDEGEMSEGDAGSDADDEDVYATVDWIGPLKP
jgi:hypothetical protein